jgi:hypothetical protein
MTAKGYGESMPLNNCTDGVKCTEEEYQVNRRTEFKITGVISESSQRALDSYIEGQVIPKEQLGIGFFEACSR